MNVPPTRAILLYQDGRYADAEQELRRALAEAPQDFTSHALLGLCLARQEKLPEAQAEVEQAIVLAPDEPPRAESSSLGSPAVCELPPHAAASAAPETSREQSTDALIEGKT